MRAGMPMREASGFELRDAGFELQDRGGRRRRRPACRRGRRGCRRRSSASTTTPSMGEVSVVSRWTSRARRSAASACATFAFARSRCADADAPARVGGVEALPADGAALEEVLRAVVLQRSRWRASPRTTRAPRARRSRPAAAASTWASISRRSMVATTWPARTRSPISTPTRDSVPCSFAEDGDARARRRGCRKSAGSIRDRPTPTVNAGTSTRCSATGVGGAPWSPLRGRPTGSARRRRRAIRARERNERTDYACLGSLTQSRLLAST